MIKETADLIKHLQVYPENMKRNMNVYGGVIFSQSVLLALVKKGLNREDAYRIVQSSAHQAWNQPEGDFRSLISQALEVKEVLSPEELETCFNPQQHLSKLEEIYQRLSI
jgi:adenylosuccinate lyase